MSVGLFGLLERNLKATNNRLMRWMGHFFSHSIEDRQIRESDILNTIFNTYFRGKSVLFPGAAIKAESSFFGRALCLRSNFYGGDRQKYVMSLVFGILRFCSSILCNLNK